MCGFHILKAINSNSLRSSNKLELYSSDSELQRLLALNTMFVLQTEKFNKTKLIRTTNHKY